MDPSAMETEDAGERAEDVQVTSKAVADKASESAVQEQRTRSLRQVRSKRKKNVVGDEESDDAGEPEPEKDEEAKEWSSSDSDDSDDSEYEEKPAKKPMEREAAKAVSPTQAKRSIGEDESPKVAEAKMRRKPRKPTEKAKDKAPKEKTAVDEILERKRVTRKKEMSDTEKQELAERTLDIMYSAYKKDCASRKKKQPALEKLRRLDEVVQLLSDRRITDMMLDNSLVVQDHDAPVGIADLLVAWLKPGRTQLPNERLRTKLFRVIDSMNFDDRVELMKSSKIGKILNFYRCHPDETLENKRLTNSIIAKWMDGIRKMER